MVSFISFVIILGGMLLIFSESPYFGLFGVLIQAVSLAGLLSYYGASFFALLIILIYVGGMLIVFLFSTVLCAEPHPSLAILETILFWLGLSVLFTPWLFSNSLVQAHVSVSPLIQEINLGEVFGGLSLLTCLIAVVLLICLIVVLLLGFEHTNSSVRKL
uniref:NADH-ubiquinone oxidoreductase chain 6 n=1 Tax=Ophiarachnella infernalis TaxID=2587522 RepID=A0A513X065_9ECHI|nr:NADH dehydrogenase subunit 6 [Ophiarachnella infernalis]